jgi:hypothetical protein
LQYEPKGWGFAQKLLAMMIRNRIFTADKKNAKPQTELKILFSTHLLPCCQYDKKIFLLVHAKG